MLGGADLRNPPHIPTPPFLSQEFDAPALAAADAALVGSLASSAPTRAAAIGVRAAGGALTGPAARAAAAARAAQLLSGEGSGDEEEEEDDEEMDEDDEDEDEEEDEEGDDDEELAPSAPAEPYSFVKVFGGKGGSVPALVPSAKGRRK